MRMVSDRRARHCVLPGWRGLGSMRSSYNYGMRTAETKPAGIPPDVLAEMEEAARNAMTDHRDPEAMRRACERTDRMSEEIRRRHGVLDIGVPAIRALRDSEE